MLSTAPPNARTRLAEEETSKVVLRKPAFVRSFEEAEKTAAQRLYRLLKDAGVDPVHDTRTSIRRLEAHINLLPKRVRKSPEVKELLKGYDRVMKRTAEVRDLDVIRGKVSRQKNSAKAQLLRKIDKRRKRLVKDAMGVVSDARKLMMPPAALRDVTEARLQRRLEKVVDKLTRKISGLLPMVARDSKKLDELHTLRIGGKKLRYALELAMDEKSAALLRLRKWQDALGSIHDLDVMASFLKQYKSAFATELRREAEKERDLEFREFANSVLNKAAMP